MNNKTKLCIFFFCTILISSCTYTKLQNDIFYEGSSNRARTDKMPNEPGKCFAKCLMPDKYSIDSMKVNTPIEGETPKSYILTEEILIKPASTEWVKKKADKNCMSRNPEDCLVWCLVEVPAEYMTINTVDTSQTDIYTREMVYLETIEEVGGFTQWEEVICDGEVTQNLLRQINSTLQNAGYLLEQDDFKSEVFKSALKDFQRYYNLPVGGLNLVTLDAMDIEY